ncbi:MAG: hypothetical protein FJ217_15665 [Ignavibacteria bacterium]|nr:hypothetical protein [Ignavibacteria bacterium]
MTSPASITIRPLKTEHDFLAFEALQRETWGKELEEVVTSSLAKIVQKIGGIAAGAFDETGVMLGAIFGFSGNKDGRPIHWSHMLAVKEKARDYGIGRRLKIYQRDELLKLGVTEVYWTYDPLVARNAHLNFNCLGVEATEYALDMYGPGDDSELFRGLGTDRFIVLWRIASDRVAKALAGHRPLDPGVFDSAEVSVGRADANDVNSGPFCWKSVRGTRLRIEIPSDIHRVRSVSAKAAAQWREQTRSAFQFYFANGFQVRHFYRDEFTGRCYYLLERP